MIDYEKFILGVLRTLQYIDLSRYGTEHRKALENAADKLMEKMPLVKKVRNNKPPVYMIRKNKHE